MPAEPAFVMGLILGILLTLLIQSYVQSRVRKSKEQGEDNVLTQVKEEHQEEISHLKDRLMVMERIVTDEGTRVSKEIENLR